VLVEGRIVDALDAVASACELREDPFPVLDEERDSEEDRVARNADLRRNVSEIEEGLHPREKSRTIFIEPLESMQRGREDDVWQGRAIGQVVHADPMVESIEPASPGDGVAHGVRVVRHPMAPPSVRRQDALADEVTEPPRGPAGAANRGEECEGLVRGHGRVRTGSERLPCASLEGVASARIREDEDPSRDLEMFSEAERRRGPERPDALPVDPGVEGLARIFEEDQSMPTASFPKDFHRIRDAVQVRRQDGAQPGPCAVTYRLLIEVPGVLFDGA